MARTSGLCPSCQLCLPGKGLRRKRLLKSSTSRSGSWSQWRWLQDHMTILGTCSACLMCSETAQVQLNSSLCKRSTEARG